MTKIKETFDTSVYSTFFQKMSFHELLLVELKDSEPFEALLLIQKHYQFIFATSEVLGSHFTVKYYINNEPVNLHTGEGWSKHVELKKRMEIIHEKLICYPIVHALLLKIGMTTSHEFHLLTNFLLDNEIISDQVKINLVIGFKEYKRERERSQILQINKDFSISKAIIEDLPDYLKRLISFVWRMNF